MDTHTNSDESFERLKEKLFGNKKNDEQKRKEFLNILNKNLEQQKKEDEYSEAEEKKRKEEDEKKWQEEERKFEEQQNKAFEELDLKLKENQKSLQESLKFIKTIEEANTREFFGKIYPELKKKSYNFSSTLVYEKLKRFDISDWKYSANFIINYCNKFSLPRSEKDEIETILKSRHFIVTLQSLHEQKISADTFSKIINGNKPLISFGLDPVTFLRKNALFMIMYIQNISKVDKRHELKTDLLAQHWLKSIISHSFFANIKVCIFLNKEYPIKIDINKLSTIKYFNDIILGKIENSFREQSLDFSWLILIRRTYARLFEKDYDCCVAEKKIALPFFSRDELEMFVYIIVNSIVINENFPYIFENLIFDLLIEEGISPQIIVDLKSELSALGTRSFH